MLHKKTRRRGLYDKKWGKERMAARGRRLAFLGGKW